MASNVGEPPRKVQKLSVEKTSNYAQPFHFSDIVLVVEGRKFHVHKGTLSMASPVFEKMFSSDFKEKNSSEIDLPGKKAEEFEVFLNIIYDFKENKEVNGQNYQFLLALADEYQLQKVRELCEEFMACAVYSGNCVEFVDVSNSFGLDNIMSDSLEIASCLTMESIQSTTSYSEATDEAKIKILTKRLEKLEGLLKSYYSTSSKLCERFYHTIAKKCLLDYRCSNFGRHELNLERGVFTKKKFDMSCWFCTTRIEAKWPEKFSFSITSLKDNLMKIKHLSTQYKDMNGSVN